MNRSIQNPSTAIIDEVFPYKVCINLDRRPERWQDMQRKFDQHGIHSVQRFSAVDGNKVKLPENWVHSPGAYGCLRSHLEVVREAQQRGVPSVLIFEDDVVFDEHLEKKFGACIEQLPPDWDMLFFGAIHKDEPIPVSDHIARLTQAYSTYAYVLRDTTFADFIELNRETQLELDHNCLILQRRFNSYCLMPHLAWVETAHSDAQQRLVDHWYLRESLVLFSPQVDRLLSETTLVLAHGNHDGVEPAADNLMFLLHYYDKFFSGHLAMVVVEQGAQPTVNPATLPAKCKYVFLRDSDPFDRERCFLTGISHSDPNRKRFILSDSDVYLETLHIRANLRMCERYDYVTGFSEIIGLNKEDSARLRTTNMPQGIDFVKNHSPANGRQSYCLFVNRETIPTAGRDGEGVETLRALLSSPASPQHRVFKSPNHALRLE